MLFRSKAHTIDWDTGRLEKHLRFGQPLEYYNPDDFRRFFPVRTIAGEERASLTGSFHQGMQDNLIVLTDSYFQENYDRITAYNRKNWETRQKMTREEWRMYTVRHQENLTEGPTTLFCMNLDDALVDQAAADLEYLNEEQDFDTVWDNNIQPFYVKSQMIVNTESEIFFTRMGNGFILLVLMILGVFQFFVKVKSEEDNWRWENIFSIFIISPLRFTPSVLLHCQIGRLSLQSLLCFQEHRQFPLLQSSPSSDTCFSNLLPMLLTPLL